MWLNPDTTYDIELLNCKDYSIKTRIVTLGIIPLNFFEVLIAKIILLKQGLWQIFLSRFHLFQRIAKIILLKQGLWLCRLSLMFFCLRIAKIILLKQGLWRCSGGAGAAGVVIAKIILLKQGLWLLPKKPLISSMFYCKDYSIKTRIVTCLSRLIILPLILLQRLFY